MANFRQGGGGGFGGGNRGGGSRFNGGRDSHGGGRGGDREIKMHEAVCAECKKTCEVPFRPTNDRPVYCRDCFSNKGGSSGDNRAPRADFGNRSFSKPRFEGNRNDDRGNSRGGDDVKRQLEMINIKLDKLISVIGANVPKPAIKEVAKEAIVNKGDLKDAVKKAVKSGGKAPAKKKAPKKK